MDVLEITESDALTQSLLLTTLVVTDEDLSSQLEFSISNNPDGVFSINNRGQCLYNVPYQLLLFFIPDYHLKVLLLGIRNVRY